MRPSLSSSQVPLSTDGTSVARSGSCCAFQFVAVTSADMVRPPTTSVLRTPSLVNAVIGRASMKTMFLVFFCAARVVCGRWASSINPAAAAPE